jgi:hypothetical protein
MRYELADYEWVAIKADAAQQAAWLALATRRNGSSTGSSNVVV